MTFERVCVVGAGLIGGSVALRLHDLGVAVSVSDPDPAVRTQAAAVGLEPRDDVDPDADLVVVATPLDVLPEAFAAVAAAGGWAPVVDVGSVKAAAAEAAGRAEVVDRFVGCHPMAGSERAGFGHADAGLLLGATWAVCHPHPSAVGHLGRLVPWLVDTFDARVALLDPTEHDRAVALISHAPHVVANALLGLVGEDATGVARLLAAGSFRDTTRVAGTHPDRTRNMLVDNARALGPVVDELIEVLHDYRRELGDPGALGERLRAVAEHADAVREPDPRWRRCHDLDVALASACRDAASVLVRRVESGWQTASV